MATTKPVWILAIGMDKTPELYAMAEDGHTVHDWMEFEQGGYEIHRYDVVLGPKCWRISPEHMKFLPLAIKEARAAMPKKPPKKK